MINLDTNAAITLVSEGSPERHQIKAFAQGHQIVMTQTSVSEFRNIVVTIAGPLESTRAQRLLSRLTIVADQPSARAQKLRPTGSLTFEDIVILGTGDQLGATTVTADGRAVRAAAAQGVKFDVFLHAAVPLTGS